MRIIVNMSPRQIYLQLNIIPWLDRLRGTWNALGILLPDYQVLVLSKTNELGSSRVEVTA